ncbi:MAG: hypothetical protein IPM36_04365 [Lewinellaceae bacterium]|nr:hypothetical protein [Lewinellaceae bacterium]
MLTPADRQFIQDYLRSRPAPAFTFGQPVPRCASRWRLHRSRYLGKSGRKSFLVSLDLIIPPVRSVEQASSEETARFKAGLFSGKPWPILRAARAWIAWFFPCHFNQVVYVEQQPQLVGNARQ